MKRHGRECRWPTEIWQAHRDTGEQGKQVFLGTIWRSYTFLDSNSMLQLYISIIRLHLEHGREGPHADQGGAKEGYKNGASTQEGKLWGETDFPPFIIGETWLGAISAHTLCIRLPPCLIWIPPVLLEDTVWKWAHTKETARQHVFLECTTNHCNSLLEEVVSAPTLNTFKNRLNTYWKEYQYYLEPLRTCHLNYSVDTSEEEVTVETVLQVFDLWTDDRIK